MKNKLLVGSIIFIITFPVSGQSKMDFSYSFENKRLTEALLEIEQDIEIKFYYADEWIDTIVVNKKVMDQTLDGILTQLFVDTKIDFIIFDDRIILTYNSPIIKEIPENDKEEPTQELVYIYTKEYINRIDDPENKTFEIGEKSKLRLGGKANLAGYIRDSETGDPVIGAVVYIENTSFSAIADDAGFYSIRLPRGLNIIRIQSTGMKKTKRKVMLYSDGSMTIEMVPETIMLEDILLEAERDINITSTKMGVNRFSMSEAKNVPKILGENDIIQIALALPGIQSVGEGAAGINVRGGKADQNLMLLNQAVVYNPYHFFGFFSSFNADVISSGELYKSSIPAKYGGRLSSVFDIKVKRGKKDSFSAQGGISPVTTRLSMDIPIIKDKASLVTGFRTTYSDWVLNFVDNQGIQNSNPFFLDGVIGYDHQINDKNSIHLTGYFSKDKYKLSTDSVYSYTNTNIAAIWDHNFTSKFNGEFKASYSEYAFGISFENFNQTAFNYGFDIRDESIKVDLEYQLNKKHQFYFGGEAKLYQLNPGYQNPLSDSSQVAPTKIEDEKGLESALFFSDEWTINESFTLTAGLRFSIFNAIGPKTISQYNEGNPRVYPNIIGTKTIDDNKFYQTYMGPEYRISARYSLSSLSALKFSINRTQQFLHILTNNISVAPTNTWKLSDTYIKPQKADQISLGFYQNIASHTVEASAEIYYKKFEGLLDFKTGSQLSLNKHIEKDVLQGEGYAYGIELLLKKKNGRFNGWIGYAYSRSFQRFNASNQEETINHGNYFPTNYDKPHDFSLASNYRLTRRYSFSLNVNYSTGRPITYPTGKYMLGGSEVVQYSDRNKFRIPDYFRIDVGINIEGNHKLKKLAHGFWTLSVYNLLGRDNVYSIYFVPENGEIVGKELSIFAVPIPTITYNFKF